MPGACCTRSLVCSVESTRVSHHRCTGTPGIPCAMVLTVSFVLSPVIGLSCHRHRRDCFPPTTPASRRQDHTRLRRPRKALSSAAPPASTASRSNVRDDRDTPLKWDRTAADIEVIWVSGERKYFCKGDWTTQITLIHLDKIASKRKPSAS